MTCPLCPISIYGGPVTLLKFQMAARLTLLVSSGSKEQQPRFASLCKAKASHSQRMWAEVSSSAPHLLHNGLSDSPSRWRCLLRVLCPVRRPVTAMDCPGKGQKPCLGTQTRSRNEFSSLTLFVIKTSPPHPLHAHKIRIQKEQQTAVLRHITRHFTSPSPKPHGLHPHLHHLCDHPFIQLACAECDDSLPFSGTSSIPLCYVLFPATLLHQLFFHPLPPHLAIYFLVYLSILLFQNSYIIPFWEFYFIPFSVHAQTNMIYSTLLSLL